MSCTHTDQIQDVTPSAQGCEDCLKIGGEMKARTAQATMTLEEVQAALDRAGGQPLSELMSEQRGPKA
jgi:hypothetical protein